MFPCHVDCERQKSSQESFCGDFGPDGTPPAVQDGKGGIYWDMGEYLLKIDPYVKNSEEKYLPQTKIKVGSWNCGLHFFEKRKISQKHR